MPGAIGAIAARRKQKKKDEAHMRASKSDGAGNARLTAAEAEDRKIQALKDVMNKYDTNNSGKLEEDQVRRLLTDIDDHTPPGTPPHDEEVQFILKVADQEGDNCLTLEELQFALRTWHTFTKMRANMEAAIDKFDKSGEGTLSKDELKAYLTSLNDGNEVSDSEVTWVLKEADLFGDGVISKPELVMATSAWYCHAEKRAEDAPPPAAAPPTHSQCCALQ